MRGNIWRGTPRALAALVVFLAFFAWAAVLLGAGEETAVAGEPVQDPPLLGFPLLLAQEGDQAWLVFGGYQPVSRSKLLRLDPATGQTLASADWDADLLAAFFQGGSLFLWEAGGDLVRLTQDLEEAQRWPAPAAFFQRSQCALSAGGGLYLAEGSSAALYPREGERESREFPAPVDFLQLSPQGRLYLCAGGQLYLSEDGSLEGLSPVAGGREPHCLLGDQGFLDQEGMVCRVQEGEALPVLASGLVPMAGETSLYAGDSRGFALGEGERVWWYSWGGEPLGSCLVPGQPVAVTTGLVLYQQDGSYYCGPTGFGEGASPSPEATAAPSPSPGPSCEPSPSPGPEPGGSPGASPLPTPLPTPLPGAGWVPTLEGEYLVAPLGATVEELRQFFRPQSVEVCRPDGTVTYRGRLTTGMTVEDYTLVVPGDVTGAGAGNNRDLQAVQAHLLEESTLAGPYLRAADLNGDGEVTVEDLVFFGSPAPEG